ncbi:hypothetical protein FGADI_13225 [Fusarium gaditjirri]|uniref:3'-5' exonuclease domain-containing protein n=1 Tax=Fusarium gaditjirri TaxID=282569 RepID=A0A8H4SQ77_9HYPO|nr:hypothetical protein FGADI_13225 [Fusarium gaditjirri]
MHSIVTPQGYLTSDVEVISTIQGVKSLADGIAVLNACQRNNLPLLYIDIEPRSLGANGELNLLTILLCYGPQFRRRLYLVDINVLANQAFSTRGYYGASLRSILDSPAYQKVFFGVRHNSHILYDQYGVKLQRVHDLQLMENAYRPYIHYRQYLERFEPLIQKLLVHGISRRRWFVDKYNGEWKYRYGPGAPHAVFQKRPVIAHTRLYCCRNVRFMPELYAKICRGTPQIIDMVAQESQNRVHESQKEGYDPFASEQLRNPWTAEQNEKLDSWAETNPDFDDLRLGNGIL